jgi:RecB family exonuclease
MLKIDELNHKSWRTVSASQIKTFGACQAKWWYEKVAGLRGEGSAAMERGTLVHAILEHTTVHGRNPTVEHILGMLDEYPLFVLEYLPKYGNDRRRLVDWLLQIAAYAAPYLPFEQVSPLYVERGFLLNDPDLPVPALGYIDLMEPDDKGITDYKVRSTGRYAATVEDLGKDPQSALYAAVLQAIHDADPSATRKDDRGYVTTLPAPVFSEGYFRHLNLCIKEGQGFEVRLPYTADDAVAMYREYIVKPAQEMAQVAKITDPRLLTANPKECQSYGRTCPHYNLCVQAGHVEPREIDQIMSAFDLTTFLKQKKQQAAAPEPQPEQPRLTGINPPEGVSDSVNSRPDEFSADYKAKGPYFPNGEAMAKLRKMELRAAIETLYGNLTPEQVQCYNSLTSLGERFREGSTSVADLRVAATALIRSYAGDDEVRCRQCAVDPLVGWEPDPLKEQPAQQMQVAIEPVLQSEQEPVVAPTQRIALLGCYVTTRPMVDFRVWSCSMRETVCKVLNVSDLGDAEYAKGYKTFAQALRSSDPTDLLPDLLYVDPNDPLTSHILPWLEEQYLVVRR